MKHNKTVSATKLVKEKKRVASQAIAELKGFRPVAIFFDEKMVQVAEGGEENQVTVLGWGEGATTPTYLGYVVPEPDGE